MNLLRTPEPADH